MKGPRRMTVGLPVMRTTGTHDRVRIVPRHDGETLLARTRAVESYTATNPNAYARAPTDQVPPVVVMHNKAPQWNEATQSYVLNFGGRVTLASVKNFQLVHGAHIGLVD